MKRIRPALWICLFIAFSMACEAEVPTIQDGWTAYEAGDFTRAYEVFSGLLRETPQSESVNFAYGMSALALDRLSHALFAFERVLMMNPDNHRARLELARTYTAMEQYGMARREFQRVMEAGPPEQVQRNIERYLAYMDRRTKRWSGGGQLGLSVFHDDNVNVGPSSRFIETVIGVLEVADGSQPKESWGASLGASASATYDAGARGGWLFTGGFTGYGNWLADASDQEIGYARVEAGFRHVSSRVLLDLPVKCDYLEVGHERYLLIGGFEPSLLFAASPEWHHITRLVLEQREYREGDSRDGPYYRAEQTLKRFFGQGARSLALTAGYYYEDAQVKAHEAHGFDVALGGEARIASRTTVYGFGQYKTMSYQDKLLPGIQDKDRSDNQWQAVVGIMQSLSDGWGVTLNYRRVNNNSNFGLYEYERNVFSLSTYLQF
jgi:tetratricopeptide (TPR) repeat protein